MVLVTGSHAEFRTGWFVESIATLTRFYRAPHARTPRPASTHAERLERRIRRRASRFIHHPARGPAPGSRSPLPHRQGS